MVDREKRCGRNVFQESFFNDFNVCFSGRMKVSDKRLFSVQADVCKALANAKRLEIIHALGGRGRRFAAELMESAGLTKTNLSQHMRVLEQTGIVVARREGTRISYELASPRIEQACELLSAFLLERLERNGRLAGEYRAVRSPNREAE
jgi:ArsR family transcriptional regulator, virulence genes transcriptional regulator